MKTYMKWVLGVLLTGSLAFAFPNDDPYSAVIHTTTNQLKVSSDSRLGEQLNVGTAGFHYFTDSTNYLFDGSLILGNSASNLSWSIYKGLDGPGPTIDNPFGYLQSLTPIVVDSTTSPDYTSAAGTGTNRDSTIGYSVTYYAPKQPDSADFYVAHFKLYKGLNNPTGIVSSLTVAYAADWNIPSDTGVVNTGGFDVTRSLIYQQGTSTSPNTNRFGGISLVKSYYPVSPGGFVWENDLAMSPEGTYENDSLWNKMQSISGASSTGATGNLNSILVIYRNAVINGATKDTLSFYLVFAGQSKETGSLAGLKLAAREGKRYICTHLNPSYSSGVCPTCVHGDANNDHQINISDAVFLIQFIFAGGAGPNPPCNGDFNCDCVVNISDVVCMVTYIFQEGICGPFGERGCPASCETCPDGYCGSY